MYGNILKIFIVAVTTFGIGIALTPWLSDIMYTHKLWKRSARSNRQENPEIAAHFSDVHNNEKETSTPRVGGMVVWLSVFCATVLLWILSRTVSVPVFESLDVISRGQTWLLFFGLLVASLIGLTDDLLQIFGNDRHIVDGLARWQRIFVVVAIGCVGALWLYIKLGVSSIHVPFVGPFELGIFFVLVFIVVTLATFSSSVIDGLDGLAGGVLATNFAAYAIIAFFQNQMNIAAFCAMIVGGILAFLWFNVPPARFYMGETGMLGLTVTLALVAFFTNQVLVLLIIGFPLVVTSISAIVQMISKKYFKRSVFRLAPLHHHFQAMGWSSEKITMRYWIVSIISATIGVIVALLG